MKLAERIQYLRKMKGISQEELAEKAGVSRQAVSKWESDQSTPDVEKIIIMSDYFGVTTDYILKGIQTVESKEQKSRELASKVLYISSAAFVVIGLFCAFGGWYAQQTMEAVLGSNDRSSSRCCRIFYSKHTVQRKGSDLYCVDSYQWNRFYACIYHDRIYCRPSFQARVDFSLSNRDRSYLSICSCIPVRFDYELFHSEETTGKCS